ncbi:MAG: NAD-dependent epimerase/dehydratase family protein [Candidatus Cloacimonetes bacterium]|nr:NAD-dependent epimerase/dehydratase family protein [Candidatus Cloacimonadota bacterium]
MKKVVITGANGFIGSRLAAYLQQKGYDVVCLVRQGSDTSLLSNSSQIKYIDYHTPDSWQEAFAGCQILIHAAALTRARKWADFQKTNIDLVEQLISFTNTLPGFEQFIFLSSQAASGPAKSGFGKTESDDCYPISSYGKSKLAAEQIIQKSSMPWTIFRPVSVFGPGEKDFYQYYKMIQKGIAPLIGISDKHISLVYVDDLCAMIELSIAKESAYNQCFFAAGVESVSMAGFAYIIAEALDRKIFELSIAVPILYVAACFSEIFALGRKTIPVFNRKKLREMNQRYWLASHRKVIEILGWQPDMTLARQMQITIKWYKERKLL